MSSTPSHDSPPRFSWRTDGVVLLIALCLPTISTWLYFVVFAGQGEARKLVYTGSKLVQALLPIGWMWIMHREEVGWPRYARTSLLWGFAFGVLTMFGMRWTYEFLLQDSVLLAGAPYAIQEKISQFGIGDKRAYRAMVAFICIVHSAFEEYYWRWFVFGRLRLGIGWPLALAVSSIGFALHHVIVLNAYLPADAFWSATVPLSCCVGFGGAAWAFIYQKTGSLVGPWLAHAMADVALMMIGLSMLEKVGIM